MKAVVASIALLLLTPLAAVVWVLYNVSDAARRGMKTISERLNDWIQS